MGTVIEEYRPEHEPGVREFNRRLQAGGEREFEFPETAVPDWLPPAPGRTIYQQYFVAVDPQGVRGGYVIKRQDFALRGGCQPIGFLRLPLSEGIVDPAYGLVGSQLLIDATRRQPLMFALGMGGFDRPLPRMLAGIGWKLAAVPFLFRVVHASRFLRQIRPLRTSAVRRLGLDTLALTGLGTVVVQAAQGRLPRAGQFDIISDFDDWASDLWERHRNDYTMIGARDLSTLRALYPPSANDDRFVRVRVGSKGWAVVLDTPMRDHKYFGDLRVGTIADCFAAPEDAVDVVRAAAAFLQARGVDLIVSNQLHTAWVGAFRSSGFRSGPSNFVFAASRKLAALLDPFEQSVPKIHMTRGDGDGPVHL